MLTLCEFCDIWKFFGHRPRVKRAANLLAELDALYTLGWHGPVFVVDDNFIGNRRRVKQELLPALIDWQQAHGHVFQFNTEATVDLGRDEPLLEAMRRAGFNQVFLGIETPSAAGLREAGKTNNLRTDMLQAVKTIQRHGLEVMGGFIIGFDSDTESIFDQQIDFIQQAGIPKAMVGLLSALPGSALAERLEREGRLTADFNGSNTHRLSVNFIPRMAPQRLIAGYLRVLATIYDSDLSHYFQRCNQMLDTIEYAEFFQRRIGWRELRAVVLSLLRQPFAPYGRQYLRFIARNLRRHPRIFGEVLSYAITGHHLFVITRDILARAARNPLPDRSGQLTARRLDGAANLPTASGCAN